MTDVESRVPSPDPGMNPEGLTADVHEQMPSSAGSGPPTSRNRREGSPRSVNSPRPGSSLEGVTSRARPSPRYMLGGLRHLIVQRSLPLARVHCQFWSWINSALKYHGTANWRMLISTKECGIMAFGSLLVRSL